MRGPLDDWESEPSGTSRSCGRVGAPAYQLKVLANKILGEFESWKSALASCYWGFASPAG
jgi:hypothetical protein